MKQEAKNRLIKDIVTAVVAGVIVTVIFLTMLGSGFSSFGLGELFALVVLVLVFGGIPFGWRWLSKVVTAIGLWGILIKFIGAFLLGWVALPVVIVKDIIAYVRAE